MEQLVESQLAHWWKVGPVAVVMFLVIIGMALIIKKLFNEIKALQASKDADSKELTTKKDADLKELAEKKDAVIENLNQYIRETHVEMMGLAQEFTSAVNHSSMPQVKFTPKLKKTKL